MADLQVAQTILDQMGGTRRISLMVGASGFIGDTCSVQFSFKGSRKMNKIIVKLNEWDTYDIEFWKINARKGEFTRVSEARDVYFDQLISVFESETGLYLSL